MNGVIKRKLMETERSLTSIEQWYKCVTNLNRYWRKSQKKIKRKKRKQKSRIEIDKYKK